MSTEISGKKIAILGYGREGHSTHRFLLKRYPEAEIAVFDKASVSLISEAPRDTKLFTGSEYLARLRDYDTIIHSPGLVMSRPPIADTWGGRQKITSATNLFFAVCPGKTVGITGTKGKSTTSALIAAMLKTQFGDVRFAGNIGAPMLEALPGATEKTIFVIELSSFQLEDIHYSPHVAVLLNIVPEHLDHHGTYESYAQAKINIARFQNAADVLILNSDFAVLTELTAKCIGQRELFNLHEKSSSRAFVKDNVLQVRTEKGVESLGAISELPLRGEGNVQNMLAATVAGLVLGVPVEKIRYALKAFVPLEHRLETFGTFRGISFVNDSLSTIPEALANALNAFAGTVTTVIAGGFDRGLDYAAVGPALAASGVKNVILFPDTGEKIWRALQKSAPTHAIKRFDVKTMEEAVKIAYEVTPPKSVCLMSPASSSFNLFRDYRERGEKFKELVRQFA